MCAALATTGAEWQPASSHRDVYPTRCDGMHRPLCGCHDCPQTIENGGASSMHFGSALQIHSTIASESLKHSALTPLLLTPLSSSLGPVSPSPLRRWPATKRVSVPPLYSHIKPWLLYFLWNFCCQCTLHSQQPFCIMTNLHFGLCNKCFFIKNEAKALLFWLIKKKRVAR
jgi:hypothetical protein